MVTATVMKENIVQVKRLIWSYKAQDFTLCVMDVNNLYMPLLLEKDKPVWSGGAVSTLQVAKDLTKITYHKFAEDLVIGRRCTIDPELLVRHPKNSLIYVNDTYEDLKTKLYKEDAEVHPLTATALGLTVSGNRRNYVIEQINEECIKAGVPRKYPSVSVEVKGYDSELHLLEDLMNFNHTRPDSVMQRLITASLMDEVETIRAKERKQNAVKLSREGGADWENQKGRRLEKVAQATGFGSENTLRSHLTAADAIASVQSEAPELARMWSQVQEKQSAKAALDIVDIGKGKPKADELKLKEAVCKEITSSPKRLSVKSALKNVLAREAQAAVSKAEAEGKIDIVAIHRAKNDKPTDNWYSPKSLLFEVERVFRNPGEGENAVVIGCDPFADINRRVNAKCHHTIEGADINGNGGGFTADWKAPDGDGRVYANIPYSKKGKAFESLRDQIKAGNCTEAIVVSESEALYNVTCQQVIKELGLVAVNWRYPRLEFEPGEFLLAEKPDLLNSKNNSRINITIFYYGANTDKFFQTFGQYGNTWIQRESIKPALTLPQWDEIGCCMFMGLHLCADSYETDQDGFNLWEVRIEGATVDRDIADERTAKAIAIGQALLAVQDKDVNPFS